MDLWTLTVASPTRSADFAAAAEQQGWAGMLVVDSQNLSGDAYVALALAATSTSSLGLGTGVTNPVTRHPAVTAAAIASIQKISKGRACLGIGRGDSALAHLGSGPARLAAFERYLRSLQSYLAGRTVPFADSAADPAVAPPVAGLELADTPGESRITWLDGSDKVPVEVAATGPKVIALSALHADRIMFTLGADVARLTWGIELARQTAREAGRNPDDLRFGAYVNMVCHPDIATARALVKGGLTTYARFSVMHGSISGPVNSEQAAVLNQLHDRYNMKEHTRADSQQAETLTPEFIDRFAIVGTPDVCQQRLAELRALGLEKLVVTGATAGADRIEAKKSQLLLQQHLLRS
jgi:5,10-methylenetetrahydromethanopterin reductase